MDSLFVNIIHQILPTLPAWLVNSVADVILLLIGGLLTTGGLYIWLKRNWVTIGIIYEYIGSLIAREQGNPVTSNEVKKANVIQAYTKALVDDKNSTITKQVDKVMGWLGGIGKVIEFVLPFVKKNNPKLFGK
jgi:hypothetical protein